MKKCKICKDTKDYIFFRVNKNYKDGHCDNCRECDKKRVFLWKRTKTGVISTILSGQKSTSRRRGHSLPRYSIEELNK